MHLRLFSTSALRMSEKRITYKVTGHVQGVNYRAHAQQHAQQLGLTGHVKNHSDGSVIGEAQGPESALETFVERLRRGPPHARVEGVETRDVELKEEGEGGFVRLR